MKSLNIYLEGLLNKSNKSNALNVGEEIVDIITEKSKKENKKNQCKLDPCHKNPHHQGWL